MTAPEYIQLKAFARADGFRLALLWIASFACYVAGLRLQVMGMAALALALVTPFYVTRRLKLYRDEGLGGVISFSRGWGYVAFTFFYACLLFALGQVLYFAYLDHGYLGSTMAQLMATPEAVRALSQTGLTQTWNEALSLLFTMRPIDLALNIMTSNLLIGFVVGVPIAAVAKRERIEKVK